MTDEVVSFLRAIVGVVDLGCFLYEVHVVVGREETFDSGQVALKTSSGVLHGEEVLLECLLVVGDVVNLDTVLGCMRAGIAVEALGFYIGVPEETVPLVIFRVVCESLQELFFGEEEHSHELGGLVAEVFVELLSEELPVANHVSCLQGIDDDLLMWVALPTLVHLWR